MSDAEICHSLEILGSLSKLLPAVSTVYEIVKHSLSNFSSLNIFTCWIKFLKKLKNSVFYFTLFIHVDVDVEFIKM